jgi:hypothetical protein
MNLQQDLPALFKSLFGHGLDIDIRALTLDLAINKVKLIVDKE